MTFRMRLLVSGKELIGRTVFTLDEARKYPTDDIDPWPDVEAHPSNGMGMSSYWVMIRTVESSVSVRRQAIDAFWLQEEPE